MGEFNGMGFFQYLHNEAKKKFKSKNKPQLLIKDNNLELIKQMYLKALNTNDYLEMKKIFLKDNRKQKLNV